MTSKKKFLVITDHSGHSSENSIYTLLRELVRYEHCEYVDVASLAVKENGHFWTGKPKSLHILRVDDDYTFERNSTNFQDNLREEQLSTYDIIWLRLPGPYTAASAAHLSDTFKQQYIFNNPLGIYETGSKYFLQNFSSYCPPMRICESIEDIREFKAQFPIVLKPKRDFGGRGLVRIQTDKVWLGEEETSWEEFEFRLQKQQKIEYLGMKYLAGVKAGDKRIVVVNGVALGASLRLPPKDSWICNVAAGGQSTQADISPEEQQIVNGIDPILSSKGIVMYGVDTLLGDEGKRVLSEVNTMSIGGLPQIARQNNDPTLIKKAMGLIWESYLRWLNREK